MRHLPILALAMCLACSSGSTPSTTKEPKTPVKPGLTIFLTSELKGTIEPCGCTTDPLGDLARTAEVIAQARAHGPVVVLDGGSTLYSQIKLSDHILAQEQLKSTLIANTYRDQLDVAAMAVGPYDLSEGPGKVRPARQAVNIASTSGVALQSPRVIEAGGIKLGVFGVVSPATMKSVGIEASEAAPAAAKAIAELKRQGAQVILALAHMPRVEARALVKATPGMDFVLIGQNLPEPDEVQAEPMQIGDTWLFRPANRGQVVSRLRLARGGEGPYVDAIGEVRAAVEIERLEAELEALRADLQKWEAAPDADPGFVASKKRELKELQARKAELTDSPLQAPVDGNYFTLAQLRIAKGLDCQADVVAAKQAYDKAAGRANVIAAEGVKPEPAGKGEASYVGVEECSMCHQEAVDFWKKTSHAGAWETLESLNKQFNFDCIGCHVTGWKEPGGSNIAHNESLRDVQCEQCHGPGSLHVDAEDADRSKTIAKSPKEALCLQCHSPEHSDTFQFEAYLRDVTGPGHGPGLRASLGDGPTGHELRAAALKRAGAALGENCPK